MLARITKGTPVFRFSMLDNLAMTVPQHKLPTVPTISARSRRDTSNPTLSYSLLSQPCCEKVVSTPYLHTSYNDHSERSPGKSCEDSNMSTPPNQQQPLAAAVLTWLLDVRLQPLSHIGQRPPACPGVRVYPAQGNESLASVTGTPWL